MEGNPKSNPEGDARLVEALLFASREPVGEEALAASVGDAARVQAALKRLEADYATRGVALKRVAGGWALRTAEDLRFLLRREIVQPRKLSRAAMETLAIIATHQPITRAEIEDIRGTRVARGSLDTLLETGWVAMRGKRQSPGRPTLYGATRAFLDNFGFASFQDLPGVDELKAAGLLDLAAPEDEDAPEDAPEDASESAPETEDEA